MSQAPLDAPQPPEHSSPPRPLDRETRQRVKQWLEIWRRVGPELEAERWASLAASTEEQAAQACRRVFELWQPDWPSDDGEGLLLQQRAFALARRSP
jgi:hypothetical protein